MYGHKITAELVEVLKQWEADPEQARHCLADALTDYTVYWDARCTGCGAWEADDETNLCVDCTAEAAEEMRQAAEDASADRITAHRERLWLEGQQ